MLFRLTYGKEVLASNQMKSFHAGLDDEIYLIGSPTVYTTDGFKNGIEVLKMVGLDAFEVFYLNSVDGFKTSYGAVRHRGHTKISKNLTFLNLKTAKISKKYFVRPLNRDTFTIIPSDDGQQVLMCK